jgi:hypothetical protein
MNSAVPQQHMKPRSGGGLVLLRRTTPLARRNTAYFCSGAYMRSCAHKTIGSGNSIRLCVRSGGKERQVAQRPRNSLTCFVVNRKQDEHLILCSRKSAGAAAITSGQMLER